MAVEYPWMDDLADLIGMLVNQQFLEIEDSTQGISLSAQELRDAVMEYGRTLVYPPASAYQTVDVVPVGKKPGEWSVRMPLWTKEEGASDLTLEVTIQAKDQAVAITIDGLHVL